MLTQANVPAIMIALSKSTQFPRERNREMRIDTEIAVNPMSAEAKDTVIAVMRRDRQNFTRLVEDPKNWNVMSRIAGWEVRDLVGHMIDVLEGYFRSWEAAIGGKEQIPLGLSTMAEMHYDRALEFRVLFRDETLARFKKGAAKFDTMLYSLTPEQWEGGLIVSHPFAGPVPAGFYATFQIMDYGVHVYAIEYGLGNKLATMDEASARLILPFAFTFWQFQVDQEQAAGQDSQYGIDLAGPWGGKWRITVKDGKWTPAPEKANYKGCYGLFKFDNAADLALTFLGPFPSGSPAGDPEVI